MLQSVVDELKLRKLDLEEVSFKASLGIQEDIVTYGNVQLSHMNSDGLRIRYGLTSEYISWGYLKEIIYNS